MSGRSLPAGEAFLEKLLGAYERYYNINRETPHPPFAAEAEFRLHDERYFLFKAAKMSEADAREILFFAVTEVLDGELAASLETAAWEEGLSRVEAKENHRTTDIGLTVIAEKVTPEAAAFIKKCRHIKSYKFGFHGYSHFRMVAYDRTEGTTVRNHLGDTLEKAICDTKQH